MLNFARGLKLDPDYIGGGTFALLAKKGWGKTYAMRVMAEEFAKANVPFVALDPMDAFWGLRAGDNGLSVPIFGGPRADAPLEATAGKLMADLVVDEGLSMVLSLKHFGTRTAEKRFAEDFLDRLYRRNSELVHLLIDEADLFAPQKPQQGDQKLLGITENIVRRGRNNGIGITLGTQRPAVLNKDVLTQVDGLFVGRMLGPNDRNAIDAWVGEHGDTKQGKSIKDELPDLATGECWVWIPEQGVLKKVTIREASTFDSSPTRKRGTKAREPKRLADIDFGAIENKMADTIERAKADDPKELRKQVAALKKQIADELGKATPEAPMPDPIEVKVPILDNEHLNGLMNVRQELGQAITALGQHLDILNTDIDRAVELVDSPPKRPAKRPPTRPMGSARPVRPPSSPPPPPPGPPSSATAAGDGGEVVLKKAERTILNALAQFPEGRTKKQISIATGYRITSGGFRNAIGKLRQVGYADGSDPVQITEDGIVAAGEVIPVPTGQALLDFWMGNGLKQAERTILDVLHAAYPEALTKEEVSEQTGYAITSGGFRNALGLLRSLELIEGSDPVIASEDLFG